MKTAASSASTSALDADIEHTELPESAQRQLDALRAAVDIRLTALEAVLADPSRGESLESLILDLARLSTEEAQAAATRACVGIKLEAETEIAQSRKAAQHAVEHERIVSTDFRRALEQSDQRLATVEREKQSELRMLRDQYEARLSDERAAGEQMERVVAGLERSIAEARQQLEAERASIAELRAASERSDGQTNAVRRELQQAVAQISQLTADVAAEQRRTADAERAHAETHALLATERATTTELRAGAERTRAQSASFGKVQEEHQAALRVLEQSLNEERARLADLTRLHQQIEQQLAAERSTGTQLREALDRAESQRATADRDRARVEATCKTLSAELEQALQMAAGVERAKSDAQSALEGQQTTLQQAHTALQERENALQRAQSALKEQQSAHDATRATLEQTSAALREAKAAAARAANDSAQHVAGHDEIRQALLAARQDVQLAQQEADAVRTDLERARASSRAEAERLQQEVETERASAAAMKRAIEERDADLSRATSDTAQQAAGQDELRQALLEARRTIHANESELAEARRSANAELTTTRTALGVREAEAETLKSALDVERGTVRELGRKIDELDASLAAARRAREETLTARAALEEQHRVMDEAWREAETQLEKATRERDQLAAELEATRLSIQAADKPSSAPAASATESEPPHATPIAEDQWSHVRLATRYHFVDAFEIQINNGTGLLCDLSTGGCQIQSKTALKPKQAVKIVIAWKHRKLTCAGKVIWASLEPPKKGQPLNYRAGVQFTNADASGVEAFLIGRGVKL